ncbi:bifunctional folylpolyglutamate synthase/dihydrofolate synthase [Halobacillus shinanisalinarum]|uniref:tetrahydrofolate synthase n=1 Tax=Halobacillus shinanisalinarum TaxID=2932258 RepID=A0ABY4H5K1_9BACI|nr:folylpolyglutamate synthase/dihydrofolate synthase family protein [Halobacillus shinanisalinarum]UOQ95596.1 bifunctional folylpolyglutamate synthase/dihydrofolate synthase [Halobacillus shinanisalinarum]
MSMNYHDAIQWIHSREKFKIKPGLKRMEWMMEKLGHPEQKLISIHLAGTNGKGSTLTFLRNLLQEQGCTVGTFTSPYITRFNERISINGLPIDDEDLASLVMDVQPLADELGDTEWGEPTEFEVITAIAILYFSRQPLDFVLFETGLGGRLDSTNIILPVLSMITNIGLDHMAILGDSYEQIAYEKAGIIKEDVPVITGAEREDVIEVIQQQAAMQHAPLDIIGESFHYQHETSSDHGEVFSFSTAGYQSPPYVTKMMGVHQVKNASLALFAMEVLKELGYKVERELYAGGIESARWPARFEKVSGQPLVILDGAHNQEGTQALVDTMKRHYSDRKIIILYSALRDKPVKKMVAQLEEIANEMWFTQFDFPKAMQAEEIAWLSTSHTKHVCIDGNRAVEGICRSMNEKDVLLITGSLYFISEIRKNFERKGPL